MKYILKNDFNTLKKFLQLSIIFYFLPLLTFIMMIKVTGSNITSLMNENFFSYNIKFNYSNWALIIISIINTVIYISMSYSLIVKDVHNEKENIFLRINIRRWLIYKTISLIIYILIYTCIRIFIIFCAIGCNSLNIYILLYQFLYYLLLSNLLIIVYILFSKEEIMFCLVFILSIILNLSGLILAMCNVITEIFILFLLEKKRTKIFERSL